MSWSTELKEEIEDDYSFTEVSQSFDRIQSEPFSINKTIKVFPHSDTILLSGKEISVEPRIMRLLVVLANRSGEVIPKATIIKEVWGNKWIYEEGLTKAVSELRKILRNSELIKTVPRQGYSLIGSIASIELPENNLQHKYRYPVLVAVLVAIAGLFTYSFTNIESESAFKNGIEYSYITQDNGFHIFPALAPNAKRLAFIDKVSDGRVHQLRVVENPTGKTIFTSSLDYGNVFHPVFSPSGDSVAFVYSNKNQSGLGMVDLSTGNMTELIEKGTRTSSLIDWSNDGTFLIYNDRAAEAESQDLYTYDFKTKESTQILSGPAHEMNPVISSNGDKILYIEISEKGAKNQLIIKDLDSEKKKIVLNQDKNIYDHDWIDNDQAILYTTSQGPSMHIYRLDLATGVSQKFSKQSFFSVSAQGNSVAAGRYYHDINLWMSKVGDAPDKFETIVASNRQEFYGALSPNKTKVAYISDISGTFELWTLNVATEERTRITDIPSLKKFEEISWSPNSIELTTGYKSGETSKILIVNVETKEVTEIVADSYSNRFPQFLNSNELSFISDRSGKKELWKYNISRKSTEKISAFKDEIIHAKFDNNVLYFTKNGSSELWAQPLKDSESNQATLVFSGIDEADGDNWHVVDGTLYFINRGSSPPGIEKRDLKTNRNTLIQHLFTDDKSWNTRFSVTQDQSHIVFNQINHFVADIVLLEPMEAGVTNKK